MLMQSLLLQLTLWVAATHAFFPWLPEEACGDGGTSCEGHSRRRGTDGDTVTFPLSQRTPDRPEAEPERASRAARRLSRKYDRSGLSRSSSSSSNGDASSELVRRQHNKYNVVKGATPTVADSAAIHQDGTDFSYFVDVGLGSGPKPIYMLLDTGAGTTWVMGSSCKSKPCTVHNWFGPQDSKTFQASSKAFSISYGSGQVAGTLATDSLAFAGKRVSMTFGVANATSDDFNHFPFDGILGLSMSTGATDNLLQVFKREKALKANVFGVSISRSSDGPNTGEVSFGGANPAKYTGSIAYAPVSDKAGGDWAIPLDDFAYDGKKAGISGRMAYIDTGTTFIFGPPSDLALIHAQIPGARSGDGVTYTAPCDSTKPLTVSFAGVSYTILAKDWLSGPSASGECVSNLYGHEVVKDAWLLGDAFLKNVYAVFDMDQTRIGFATRPPVPTPPSATSKPAASSTAAQTPPTASGVSSASDTAATPFPATSPSTPDPRPGLGGHETSSTSPDGSPPGPTPGSSSAGKPQTTRLFLFLVCAAAVLLPIMP